ncbi:cupin domain-containing protein [Oleisolibacter albus]|uniref:cupin domain-containing protein n=1 Tax=Oleisolibacter albus TaxID=2171757 RepID=UPI000DF283DA|nr:cupin domain-containing protein [Oleisolibacter albus]
MLVRRFNEVEPYTAPNHYDMRSLRLQGFAPNGPTKFWTGLSHFLPGGGAGPDSSPLEKVYVILSGEMTVRSGGQEVVLGPLDSCFIGPNEEREIVNRSNGVTTMLVVMPYPDTAK